MSVQYLYNSAGEWIAFCKGKYVFNTDGDWIGWLPWDDEDVVDVDGDYLGTIVAKNRLYRLPYKGYRGYPGFAGYSPLPPGAEDIDLEKVRKC